VKFLCDNCKAKYQISDDKVAGKTVRMKCRKCGHQIEVKSEVTETSVSLPPPGAPAAPAPAAGAPRKLATSLSQTKPQRLAHSEPPPASGALAGAFQRSVQDSAIPKEPPSALDLLDMSLTEEWYAAINGVPVGPIRMAELKRKVATGTVTEDSLVWQEGFEEWRPVRTIPELARIVREGQHRPSLATPPPPNTSEARSSVLPPAAAPPQAHAQPAMRTEPARTAPAAQQPQPGQKPLAPAAAARAPQVAARSNVVPITSRIGGATGAAAEKIEPAEEPVERTLALAPNATPSPAAATFQAPTPPPAPVAPPPAALFAPPPASSSPLVAADPFAMPPPAAAVAAPAALAPSPLVGDLRPTTPSLVAPPPRRGTPWWFILVAIFAGCFGVAVAVILFLQKQQPQQVVIQMPANPTVAASATGAPSASPSYEIPEVTASGAPSAKPTTTSTGTRVASTAPASTGSAIAGLGDLLKGSSGGTGPSTSSGGPAGPSTAGGFDQGSIERVINNHKLSVRKQCLERANSDKSSTKVVANITIGPSGNVQSVNASGDDPVAAKCVENQIRGWQFPAPGETKQVQVPFTFVRQ